MAAVVLAWQLLRTSAAVAGSVCVDVGDGGADNGSGIGPYWEKYMNLYVANQLMLLLAGSETITAVQTRIDDQTWTMYARVSVAQINNSEIYVSIHHDDPDIGAGFNWCTNAGIYDYTNGGYTVVNRFLAGSLADNTSSAVSWYFSNPSLAQAHAQGNHYYLPCPGECDTPDINGNVNPRYAARISAWGASCEDGQSAALYGSAIAHSEAHGIDWALADYFTAPINQRGFRVSSVTGANVILEWWEWTDNQVTYTLKRSDSCWGPWESLADVASQHGWNYYAYVDTVYYSKKYYYKLIAPNEVDTTSVVVSGYLPPATPPGTPTDLRCAWSGAGSYTLSWNASTGNVSGYRIIRTFPVGSECTTGMHEFIGTTTSTTYLAPGGEWNGFRVMAYNETGVSDVSSEAEGGGYSDTGPESNQGDRRLVPSLDVKANGTGFTFYLPQLDRATIAVYDVRGRLVATVYSQPTAAGRHEVEWSRNGRSGRVASGIYFAKLYTDLGKTVSRKFLILQ